MIDVGFHGAQIAVVDADQRGPQRQHPRQLLRVVQFYQRSHAQVENRCIEAAEVAIVEALGDQQHRIGPMHAGLNHLIQIDDEFLAQHRQRHCCPRLEHLQRLPNSGGSHLEPLTSHDRIQNGWQDGDGFFFSGGSGGGR